VQGMLPVHNVARPLVTLQLAQGREAGTRQAAWLPHPALAKRHHGLPCLPLVKQTLVDLAQCGGSHERHVRQVNDHALDLGHGLQGACTTSQRVPHALVGVFTDQDVCTVLLAQRRCDLVIRAQHDQQGLADTSMAYQYSLQQGTPIRQACQALVGPARRRG
jgi:hypothetical protein